MTVNSNLKLVVKKTTRTFEANGVWTRRVDLRVYKRESNGVLTDLVMEPESCFPINANDVEDGVYLLLPINVVFDSETGEISDCDYKLVPYNRIF